MNLHVIDWIIVGIFFLVLGGVGWYTKRFMRGVADFLVAGRGMRKYLGYAAGDAADKGAASTVAAMEGYYRGGPAVLFYGLFGLIWGIFIGKTGFIIHRYRETRIMTTPQLFEMRYSKGVRVTAGTICAVSGIINMAIFPIVAGRFFTYFSGLPMEFELAGIMIPTVHVLTAVLIGTAIAFALLGGQVSVVVTDFLQAIVMSFMFVALGYFVYRAVAWDSIVTAFTQSEKAEQLLNPFAKKGEFGLKFFILMIITKVFATGSWAPSMQKISSASTPRDARIIMLLYNLRVFGGAGMVYCGLAAFAVMTLPQLAGFGIAEEIAALPEQYQSQMIAPILLTKVLPVGIMGLLFAGMMSAFISTNDSYILTWAGIIIQDVIYPLKKKPLERKKHLWLLRVTVLLIGIFLYVFGVTYKGTEAIMIFQQLTGAIYTTGAGTLIILGLYWRRGNQYGAFTALIIGSLMTLSKFFPVLMQVAAGGIVVFALIFFFKGKRAALLAVFGITLWTSVTKYILTFYWSDISSIENTVIAYLAAFTAYIAISLITPNPNFNLEKMLNRPAKVKK